MLCRALKVSKITIREAMKLLVNDGKVVRIPGERHVRVETETGAEAEQFFRFFEMGSPERTQPCITAPEGRNSGIQ